MPRPPGLPRFNAVGPRVKWWREHRGLSQKELASKCGMAPTTLSDLENERQGSSRRLHLIAAHLRLNPHYLETDRGEPEANVAQEPPADGVWPFELIPLASVSGLNRIERRYVELKMAEGLQEIETERRAAKKTG